MTILKFLKEIFITMESILLPSQKDIFKKISSHGYDVPINNMF